MSKATISNIINATVKTLKEYSFGIFDIRQDNKTATIKPLDYKVKDLKDTNYAVAKINFTPIQSKPTSILPFRVRFTTIGEGREGVPPIGIAIIGYNNYIL